MRLKVNTYCCVNKYHFKFSNLNSVYITFTVSVFFTTEENIFGLWAPRTKIMLCILKIMSVPVATRSKA